MKNIKLFSTEQEQLDAVLEPTYVAYNEETGLVTCVKPKSGGDIEPELYNSFTVKCNVIDTNFDYFLYVDRAIANTMIGEEGFEIGLTEDDIEWIKVDGVDVGKGFIHNFDTLGEHTYTVKLNKKISNFDMFFAIDMCMIEYNIDKTGEDVFLSFMQELDISQMDFSEMISCDMLFYYCYALKNIIGLDKVNISKCKSLHYTFYCCTHLTNFNGIENWNTSNIERVSLPFYYCSSATKIDLTNWDFSKTSEYASLFMFEEEFDGVILKNGCQLTELRMGGNPGILNELNEYGENRMFNGIEITTNGIFYYNHEFDYSKIIATLPETWRTIQCYLVDGVLVPMID